MSNYEIHVLEQIDMLSEYKMEEAEEDFEQEVETGPTLEADRWPVVVLGPAGSGKTKAVAAIKTKDHPSALSRMRVSSSSSSA